MSDHWPLHARQWAAIGPPLRPSPEDVEICEDIVSAWAQRRPPRVLLLGVTPELATMRWPAGSSLVAIDRSAAMVDAVFPRQAGSAIVADWLAIPRAPGSVDWIVGDGCASTLVYPDGYRRFATELRRVLVDDGELVLRVFAAPDVPEPLSTIAADLGARRIGSFHVLKWRIAMAIQPADRNVRVVEIWRAFDRMVPDRQALARTSGWSMETIATIDVYRESEIAYSFPTVDEVSAAFAGALVEKQRHHPRYELGERCPTLLFRPRDAVRGD